jgi:hypothetical protein
MTAFSSEQKVVLQVGPMGDAQDAALRRAFDLIPLWLPAGAGALARRAGEVRAIATSVRHGCPASLIASLPRLGAISSWGAGFDTLAVDAAFARGVQVATTPDVLNECVADLAWSLLLAAARRVSEADRYVRDGQWRVIGEFPLATKVSGKRLGILGMGRIGEAIARRGTGFGMDIRYHNRSPRPGVPYIHAGSLRRLAAWCDFLVIACVGGPQTHHIVDAPVLAAIGPRGIVVNIARGTVIDEAALLEALVNGRLGAAGLDVLEREPRMDDALRALRQVVFTPHIGSATVETRTHMDELVVRNLLAFFDTGSVLTPLRRADLST